jgi:hypothetical protein
MVPCCLPFAYFHGPSSANRTDVNTAKHKNIASLNNKSTVLGPLLSKWRFLNDGYEKQKAIRHD